MGRGTSIERAGLIVGTLIFLSGCQRVGQIAIDEGRDRYNSAIQSTAKLQTLENIIRVAKHDSTSFMDVTEVDATTTLTSTAAGTVTGIGSKPGAYGTLGSLTGGVSYTEAPLVRYVPLVGQGLVAQMVRPLTVDAIESLITSNWPAVAVLDLTALSLTPNQDYSFAALNVIASLADESSVMLVAVKSELTGTQNPAPSGSTSQDKNSNASKAPPANDALMIFRRPFIASQEANPGRTRRLWQQLSSIYAGTQMNPGCPSPVACEPSPIELRTAPVSAKALKTNLFRLPMLKTYSGIGILKNATELPNPKISLVSRAKFDQIRGRPWNNPDHNPDLELGFYTLLPEEESNDNPAFETKAELAKLHLNEKIGNWIISAAMEKQPATFKERLLVYEPKGSSVLSLDFLSGNGRLGTLRRYVLIICDDFVPANAYVAYPYQGRWYYIDGDDPISQRNFNLISLLLTVMSVPSTVPPLTTSVSVGGG